MAALDFFCPARITPVRQTGYPEDMDAFREDEAMNNNVCIFYTVAWIFLGTVLAGCDSGGSAGASAEKWLEAPDAQNNYGIGANIRALESRSGPADTSCEGIIGEVRESIKNPGEHVTGMQVKSDLWLKLIRGSKNLL